MVSVEEVMCKGDVRKVEQKAFNSRYMILHSLAFELGCRSWKAKSQFPRAEMDVAACSSVLRYLGVMIELNDANKLDTVTLPYVYQTMYLHHKEK